MCPFFFKLSELRPFLHDSLSLYCSVFGISPPYIICLNDHLVVFGLQPDTRRDMQRLLQVVPHALLSMTTLATVLDRMAIWYLLLATSLTSLTRAMLLDGGKENSMGPLATFLLTSSSTIKVALRQECFLKEMGRDVCSNGPNQKCTHIFKCILLIIIIYFFDSISKNLCSIALKLD